VSLTSASDLESSAANCERRTIDFVIRGLAPRSAIALNLFIVGQMTAGID